MRITRSIFFLLVMFLLTQCVSLRRETPTLADGFPAKYVSYRHVRVPEVRQSSQKSCGAAALSAVLQYWKEDPGITEDYLMQLSAPESDEGYPIMQLRNMARGEGVLAFGLTMNDDPMNQLSEQIQKGRPVIAAVELPKGRYFGESLPVIETLDRRTLSAGLMGEKTKDHYVVVMGETTANILLMDPQYGIVHTTKSQFRNFWEAKDYAALLISAAPELTPAPVQDATPSESPVTDSSALPGPAPTPSPSMRPSFREPEPELLEPVPF